MPGIVSAEGWARFEYRARARRIEKRARAARTAIEHRRFDEARSIIEEIREIDANHPELISLGIELDAEEHLSRGRRSYWGPGFAAAAVCGGLLLGARYLEHPTPVSTTVGPAVERAAQVPAPVVLPSPAAAAPTEAPVSAPPTRTDEPAAPVVPRQMPAPVATLRDEPARQPDFPRTTTTPAPVGAGPTVPSTTPSSARATTWPVDVPTSTTGSLDQLTPVSAPVGPPDAPPVAPAVSPTLTPAVTPASLPGTVATEVPDLPSARAIIRTPDVAASRPPSAAATVAPPRDEDLVRRTLQQYRAAYESLDARSAQAVWPRVDEPALQRAFDGLQSQRLIFDDCQVQVRGNVGSAQCRGSARYVTKIGSRDPRVEPRVWTFGLRKSGDEWQIETARAER
jgi:hypothetical protein